MIGEERLFQFKSGTTFMHKLNPAVKVALMLLLSIAAFSAPWQYALAAYLLCIVFSMAALHFTPQQVLSDAKPAFAYLVMLYAAQILLNTADAFSAQTQWNFHTVASLFIPGTTYLPLLLHLALSLEITSLFYRTTSTNQFREGFAGIERFITRKEHTPFAESLSLVLTFIPRIALFWKQIDTAWKARGGRDSIGKIAKLTPFLFRTCMKEAYIKALARENRQ